MGRVLSGQNCRLPGVSGLPNSGIKLNFTKKRHPELRSGLLRSAAREYVRLLMAVRTNKIAHVLDHSHNIHFHLPEHFDGFAGVLKRDIGGRRNDDCAGKRHRLYQ